MGEAVAQLAAHAFSFKPNDQIEFVRHFGLSSMSDLDRYIK